MVKPPKIRHSKPRRDPVTIDLDPVDVKRDKDRKEPSAESVSKAPGSAARPETAKEEGQATRPETVLKAEAAGGTAAKATPAGKEDKSAVPSSSAPKTAASSAAPGGATDEKTNGDEPKAETKAAAAAAGPRSTEASGKPAQATPRTASAAEPPRSASEPTGQQPVFGRGTAAGSQKTEWKEEPSPAPPAREPVRRGGTSAIAAGIVGGVIALIGAGGLQYAGMLPSFGTDGADDIQVSELRSQFDALRQEIAAAGNGDAAVDSARVDELSASLEQIRSEIAELRTAAPGDGEQTQALQARLAELENTVGSLPGTGGAGGSPEEVAALGERVGSLEGQVTSASDAATAAQDAVSGLEERLASLGSRLQDLSEQLETQASDTGAALAIAAAGLKAAIDRGDPFMTELETFAAVAPDAPEIAALRELAASGVPTRAALAARMDDVAARMIAAAETVDEEAGYLDRLLNSMGSLITVRPIGEVEGEGVGPTVARMEAAVQADNYERAISEYETLPDAVKAAGSDFISDIHARQSADDLVARALAGALRA